MARVIPSFALEGSGIVGEQDGLVVTVITPAQHRGSRPKWTPISSVFGDFPSRPSSKRARNQIHPDAAPQPRPQSPQPRPQSQQGGKQTLQSANSPEWDAAGRSRSDSAGPYQQRRAERSTAWLEDAAGPNTAAGGAPPTTEVGPADHAVQWLRVDETRTDELTESTKEEERRAPYSSEAAVAQVESLVEEPHEREARAGNTGTPAGGGERDLALMPAKKTDHTLIKKKRGPKDWRRNRDELDRRMGVCRVRCALCGLGGTMLAIAQNELVLRDEDPRSMVMDSLKAGNSVLTLLCLCFLVHLYRLNTRLTRLRAHLYSLRPLDTHLSLRDSFADPNLWLEGLVCAAHVPPRVTFEVPSLSMENFVLYRAETVGALVNTLRLYLVWRVVRDRVLRRLPKRHTVAAFHGMSIGSAFAFKMILTGNQAVLFIAGLWASFLVLLSYWFRAAEITACAMPTSEHEKCLLPNANNWTLNSLDYFEKHNDLYVQNAAWAMFVTSTTVGYGDMVPTTHFGRTVAAVVALSGIVMSALLTASLANSLHWTPPEMSALLVLEREKARLALHHQAAERLAHWWRERKRRRKREAGRGGWGWGWGWGWAGGRGWDGAKWTQRFRHTMRATQVDVEDCLADKVKIDRLSRTTKGLSAAMDILESKILALFAPGMPASPGAADALLPDLPALLNLHSSALASTILPPPPPAPDAPAPAPPPPPSVHASALASLPPHASLSAASAGGAGLPPAPAPAPAQRSTSSWGEKGSRQVRVSGIYRDRAALDRLRGRSRVAAAGCGLLGAACAVAQNELLIQGERAEAGVMDVLKGANSALTAACLACILYCYCLSAALDRLQAHIHRGAELHVAITWGQVLGQPRLWAELIVCGVHLPPYCTLEIGTTNLTNFILYRGETVFCAVNLLRVYLPWRVLRDWMLADLPRRYTVAAFANVELGSSFAIKRMLNSWFSLCYLAALWALLVLLAGYLFRAAEMTACQIGEAQAQGCLQEVATAWSIYGQRFEKANDLYLENSVWFAFISTMTVGYGDIIPTTHSGRAVAAFAAVSGIVMASLVTASLSNLIQWSPDEQSAMGVLVREQARQRLLVAAADMLALWWRRRMRRPLSRRQRRMDMYEMRREFNEVKSSTMTEIEDCASTSTKIEQVGRRAKHIQHQLQRIASLLAATDPALPTRLPSGYSGPSCLTSTVSTTLPSAPPRPAASSSRPATRTPSDTIAETPVEHRRA